MNNEIVIRVLTIGSLAGLLTTVGMRLKLGEVVQALRKRHLIRIVAANFVIVPALVLVAVRLARFSPDVSIGMMLLAAAPFAPVVPVFARMARADLALAAGLTALFPLLSVVLTPFVCQLALKEIAFADFVRFDAGAALLVLFATIIVPLALGIALNHFAPRFIQIFLRPMEIFSEATGAASLAFVTAVEWRHIFYLGWGVLLVMAIVFELSLLLGYSLGGRGAAARRVVALGTSNRNIALALLLALQAFAGTQVVSVVVGNGLLLIFLGLVHMAFWRFKQDALLKDD